MVIVLVNKHNLKLMKPTSYLVNAGRGGIVNESDLVDAINLELIAGAGMDVYENEPALTPGLEELDNVILLTHVGSGTLETRYRMASMAVENLIAGLSGKVPPNIVNPDVLSHRRL